MTTQGRVSGKRILVTGASGFVGGRLIEIATAAGHEVHGIGRRPIEETPFQPGGYSSVDLGRVDVGDLPALPWTPDAVIHAAARATPYASRSAYERDNVAATATVLAWCERLGDPRLVHVSSSSVLYRDGDQFDLTEEQQQLKEVVRHFAGISRLTRPLPRIWPNWLARLRASTAEKVSVSTQRAASPRACSGDRYCAVPTTAAVWVIVDEASATARAMPKSITFTSPDGVSMTFAGLMSRWTMPARWL